jgi:threonine dehydratase
VFMNTPQYADVQLNALLKRNVLLKVETANPLRSFKGRGADFLMGHIRADARIVCSSTRGEPPCHHHSAERR